MSKSERVLCVNSNLIKNLMEIEESSLFLPADKLPLGVLVDDIQDQGFLFINRDLCETDCSQKQLVSYVVVHCRGSVLTYERGAKGGEPRLVRMRSLGIGGHINSRDLDGVLSVDAIYRAVQREFFEEFTYDGWDPFQFRYAGLLSHDEDDVGKVHAGLVFEVCCDSFISRIDGHGSRPYAHMQIFDRFDPNESCIINHKFVDSRVLAEKHVSSFASPDAYYSYERWSQILIDHMHYEPDEGTIFGTRSPLG